MQPHKKTELISMIVAVVSLIVVTLACARMVVQEREMGKLKDHIIRVEIENYELRQEQLQEIRGREGSR